MSPRLAGSRGDEHDDPLHDVNLSPACVHVEIGREGDMTAHVCVRRVPAVSAGHAEILRSTARLLPPLHRCQGVTSTHPSEILLQRVVSLEMFGCSLKSTGSLV